MAYQYREIIRTTPQNATDQHNTLKEISKYILFHMGYRIIGTEINSMTGTDDQIRKHIMTCGIKEITYEDSIKLEKDKNNTGVIIEYNKKYYNVPKSRILPTHNKHIADAVGIKINSKFVPAKYDENKVLIKKARYDKSYSVCCIESKISLSDYKNSFCYGAGITYVIAPKSVIPLEYIPKNIGLIEVDLENYKVFPYAKSVSDYIGVEIVKKAKSRLDPRFKDKEDYQDWCSGMVETIAKRNTNELLFWNNKISLWKKKYER